MPGNVLKLIKLCSLFSEATLETDMAKRIMLSIIPHVMTKDENYQYKGADYKALRAAVHGARDLIKYGSKACVVEMSHYGNNGGNSSKEQDQIYKAKQKAGTLWNANDYKSCLKLCTTSFNDVDHWAAAYGGHKWGKISHTLYQMIEKWEVLNAIRQEMNKPPGQELTFEDWKAKQPRDPEQLNFPFEEEKWKRKDTGTSFETPSNKPPVQQNFKFQSYLESFEKLTKVASIKRRAKKIHKKVKCINNSGGNLIQGKIYEVEEEVTTNYSGTSYKLKGISGVHSKSRFEDVKLKKVKCVNSKGTKGNLINGKVYLVENEDANVYELQGVDGTWKKDRFKAIDDPEQKKLKQVICIKDDTSDGNLEKGKTYEVEYETGSGSEKSYKLVGVKDEWYASRFKDATNEQEHTSKTPKKVVCIDGSGTAGALESGKVYEVSAEVNSDEVNDDQKTYALKGINPPFWYRKRFVEYTGQSKDEINALIAEKKKEPSITDWMKQNPEKPQSKPDKKKVICIDNSGYVDKLTLGKVYDVEDESREFYAFKDDDEPSWSKSRFVPFTGQSIAQINALVNKKQEEKTTTKSKYIVPIGTKVKCIDPLGSGGDLKNGQVYEVEYIDDDFNPPRYLLKNTKGSWSVDRFEPLKDASQGTVIKKVKCIDDYNADDDLEVGKVYEVVELTENYGSPAYKIKGLHGKWLQSRFEDVGAEESASSKKVIKKVKCIDGTNTADLLETGKVYEVIVANQSSYKLKGVDGAWPISRFEDVAIEPQKPSSSVIKKVKCINNSGAMGEIEVGEVYDVVEEIESSITNPAQYKLANIWGKWNQSRFEDVKEEPPSIIGAKVNCIDASGSSGTIVEGKTYTVKSETSTHYYLEGVSSQWRKNRFKVVEYGTAKQPEIKKPEPVNNETVHDQKHMNELKHSLENGGNLLDLEIETMKDIVILMNVFDGLAHNTASVMPKVIQEEINEWSKSNPNLTQHHLTEKYQKNVKTLMDSKEIDDPMTVYKEIQGIIESPENKHIYKDWITKIRNAPDYHQAPLMKNKKKEVALIQTRKIVKEHMLYVENALSDLAELKDKLINTHDSTPQAKEARKIVLNALTMKIKAFKSAVSALRSRCYDIQSDHPDLYYNAGVIYKYIADHPVIIMLDDFKDKLYSSQYETNTSAAINSYTLNTVHTIKRFVSGLSNVIDKNL